jgi:hypothetical protein
MKRAWPYAVALAVVVTGCYLALAPLLRSLSPAPTTTAASPLTKSDVTTVGRSQPIHFDRPPTTSSKFVGNLATTKKKKAVKKAVKKPAAATTPTPGGFAANPPSTSSSSSPSRSSSTPAATPKPKSTPAKTASKGPRSVGGAAVDQAQGGGFAGGNSSGSITLGQKPEAGN